MVRVISFGPQHSANQPAPRVCSGNCGKSPKTSHTCCKLPGPQFSKCKLFGAILAQFSLRSASRKDFAFFKTNGNSTCRALCRCSKRNILHTGLFSFGVNGALPNLNGSIQAGSCKCVGTQLASPIDITEMTRQGGNAASSCNVPDLDIAVFAGADHKPTSQLAYCHDVMPVTSQGSSACLGSNVPNIDLPINTAGRNGIFIQLAQVHDFGSVMEKGTLRFSLWVLGEMPDEDSLVFTAAGDSVLVQFDDRCHHHAVPS